MELNIRAQGLSLLLAFGGGAVLGLLYDLLRPVRRRGGDLLWDALFCLAAALLCFLFAMRAENGVLGTGELLFSLLGLLAYFHLMSPVLLPIFENLTVKIGGIWINTQVLIKKLLKCAKKLFQISRE